MCVFVCVFVCVFCVCLCVYVCVSVRETHTYTQRGDVCVCIYVFRLSHFVSSFCFYLRFMLFITHTHAHTHTHTHTPVAGSQGIIAVSSVKVFGVCGVWVGALQGKKASAGRKFSPHSSRRKVSSAKKGR